MRIVVQVHTELQILEQSSVAEWMVKGIWFYRARGYRVPGSIPGRISVFFHSFLVVKPFYICEILLI